MIKKHESKIESPPRLTEPRASAKQKIQVQIEKGREIMNLQPQNGEDYDVVRGKLIKWVDYTRELLRRLFDNPNSFLRPYNLSAGVSVIYRSPFTREMPFMWKKRMEDSLLTLESISERLALIDEPSLEESTTRTQVKERSYSRRVFIVHGRDEGAKQSVARFIERLSLEPIILHEQPNQGRTIIQKFEDYADVGFAVVLLTPDDLCASNKSKKAQESRARQNVIFELGYFIGKLGRSSVCALYEEGVTVPSDYQGVLYIPLDTENGWQLKLAKEIKAAGIEIDLNRVV
jgi:predicted nucleotide-binding protein